MVFDRWNGALQNWNNLLHALPDEALYTAIAPGKNRGIYLLGHLIAVHDDMRVLLDLGEKMYPELYEPFLQSPDGVTAQIPDAAALRAAWYKQCEAFSLQCGQLAAEDWFDKHTAVSAEDFAGEPHRNKLNIIITRTTHLSYHTGQLRLLK